jgi:hypothetical protein
MHEPLIWPPSYLRHSSPNGKRDVTIVNVITGCCYWEESTFGWGVSLRPLSASSRTRIARNELIPYRLLIESSNSTLRAVQGYPLAIIIRVGMMMMTTTTFWALATTKMMKHIIFSNRSRNNNVWSLSQAILTVIWGYWFGWRDVLERNIGLTASLFVMASCLVETISAVIATVLISSPNARHAFPWGKCSVQSLHWHCSTYGPRWPSKFSVLRFWHANSSILVPTNSVVIMVLWSFREIDSATATSPGRQASMTNYSVNSAEQEPRHYNESAYQALGESPNCDGRLTERTVRIATSTD